MTKVVLHFLSNITVVLSKQFKFEYNYSLCLVTYRNLLSRNLTSGLLELVHF